jgi:hypothetical protein
MGVEHTPPTDTSRDTSCKHPHCTILQCFDVGPPFGNSCGTLIPVPSFFARQASKQLVAGPLFLVATLGSHCLGAVVCASTRAACSGSAAPCAVLQLLGLWCRSVVAIE